MSNINITYDTIDAYLTTLDVETLYIKHADEITDNLLDQYDLEPEMRDHFRIALCAKASRLGIKIARQAKHAENPEGVHKGLGIAATFGHARNEPIEVIHYGGRTTLNPIGLACAHT